MPIILSFDIRAREPQASSVRMFARPIATNLEILPANGVNNMTQKRKSPGQDAPLGFKQAIARLIQSVPDDIADVGRRVARDAEEIERDTTDQFRDIKSGGRSFKRPFRP
jgi:hypothetical protein